MPGTLVVSVSCLIIVIYCAADVCDLDFSLTVEDTTSINGVTKIPAGKRPFDVDVSLIFTFADH